MKKNISENNLIPIKDFRDFLFDKIVPIEKIKDLNGDDISNTLPYWRKYKFVYYITQVFRQ